MATRREVRRGGSDLGCEQTCGPEHEGMTAAPKCCAGEKSLAGLLRGADPFCIAGKAEALGEEAGKSTPEAAGVGVQARREGNAE